MGRAWPCSAFLDGRALPEERKHTERWLVRVSGRKPRSMGTWKLTAERPIRAPCPKPGNKKAMPSAGP